MPISDGVCLNRHSKASFYNILLLAFGVWGWTLLCYGNIFHNLFVAEDFNIAWDIDLTRVARSFFPGSGGYRPLMFVFWFVGDLLWGYHPFAYRFVIILLHMLNGCLVFAITRPLLRRMSVSIYAGLAFIALPTSAEAVNWLTAASNEVLCGFGYLFALFSYTMLGRNAQPSDHKRHGPYALMIIGLLIALLSNEIALTLPFAAFALGYCLRRRKEKTKNSVANLERRPAHRFEGVKNAVITRWMIAKAEWDLIRPIFAILLLFLVWRTIAVQGVGGYGAEVHLRAGLFLIGDGWDYIRFFTFPLSERQVGTWFFQTVQSNDWIGLIAFSVFVLAVPPIRWPAFMTLILLAPALNIPAPYRAYVAGTGFALMIGFILNDLADRLQTERLKAFRVAPGAALITLALFSLTWMLAGTSARNAAWRTGGEWGKQVLRSTSALVTSPPNGTRFYFARLPSIVGGVFVFTWGLRDGIQAEYNNRTLDAYQVPLNPDPRRVIRRLEVSIDTIDENASNQVFLVYQAKSALDGELKRVTYAEFVRSLSDTNPYK